MLNRPHLFGNFSAEANTSGSADEDNLREGAVSEGNGENLLPSANEQELQVKLSEANDRMLRIAADFDNSRKRWEKERAEVRSYAITEFARDLLPVIDAFDNAMNAIEQTQPNLETEEGRKMSSIAEGVRMVTKVFQDSLRKHGVERIEAKGAPFNPMHHNAVARTVDASLKQETVIDEFQAGYKIADRVLRTAMVRVATPD
jgi:molecular chaperone GrpE